MELNFAELEKLHKQAHGFTAVVSHLSRHMFDVELSASRHEYRDYKISEGCELRVYSLEQDRDRKTYYSMLGKQFTGEFYIEFCRHLKTTGCESLNFQTQGWSSDAGSHPGQFIVTDHIACRLSSPLTGSAIAASGDAFIDLNNIYITGDSEINNRCTLWHTSSVEKPGQDEIQIANEAGCEVISPYVVPMSICTALFGMKIFAAVSL